ncbi:TetR/AcrR family transcriptional regulator [Nocardia sp. NBC_01009]|uniref:TetR/AcrR family transcriptional regulator n=1 Tax=Nocardia sp. NBC_01009 TaxID=2975996 RepID=UPI00386C29B8|nr:TetR/AcrR family transcriptional regulator [Nocardia sp. NBC_01009]
MGHREDLLEGAKRCLIERGYARTTARDIVAASGANLASIGYHFGSKEALLNIAMLAMSGDAMEEIRQLVPADAAPAQRIRLIWDALIESFADNRAMWTANLELAVQAIRSDDLRAQLSDGQESARETLGGFVSRAGADTREAGSVELALITGVMVQHLVDPSRAPDAEQVLRGLRAIVAAGDEKA